MRGHRAGARSGGVAAAAAAALLVTGCGASSFAVPRSPTASPTPSPTQLAAPPGTAAEGRFETADGSTTGGYAVIVEGADAWLELHDVSTRYDDVEVHLSFVPRDADPCIDGATLAHGALSPGKATRYPLPTDVGQGDWTFLSEVVLAVPGTADGSGCVSTIVARSPLEWSIPPLRPWLAGIEDTGAREGAVGSVAVDADGAALSYTVAPDDLLVEVARRFGIEPNDVFYLNPRRMPLVEDPVLSVGEVLNLSVAAR